MQSENLNLPLYDLFEAVQDLDQKTDHLTVDLPSYFLLYETMMKGYMLTSKEELLLLCEKLWIKPYHLHNNLLNKVKLQELFEEKLSDYDKTSSERRERTAEDLKNRKMQNLAEKDKSKPAINIDPVMPASEIDKEINQQQGELSLYIGNVNDKKQQVQHASGNNTDKFLKQNFFIQGKYLPVNPRRLEQSIRSYRFAVKDGPKTEIDLPATINRIARTKFFDRFEYRAEETFTTDWTILIDHSDSMAAFTDFSEEIRRLVTAYRVNKQKRNVFYFRNYPTTHLYNDRLQTSSIPLKHFIATKKMNILIISDAGAARGFYNSDRVKAIIKFLRQLKQHRVAWLNPMPKERWKDNSAEMIAEFTDMFSPGEGDNDGLSNIVRLFKSKIRVAKT